MNVFSVDEILGLIDRLSEEARRLLEERLAERADAEWRGEADAARRQARQLGLTQEDIDRAVSDLRYPR